MKITNKLVKDLIPYDKNTKKHDKTQIKNVAESIKQYGFVQPIVVDKDNVVVIGHCRLMAAKQLKMQEVPCVLVDDLTEEQVRALRIVDNKSNESDWDLDFLADELFDLDLSMFDFDFDLDEEEEEKEVQEVEVPPLPAEPIAKRGDIYRLGNHYLMCGDSTSEEDVSRLLGGRLADLVVTDPPYNMAYEGAGNTKDRVSKRILNDKMSSAAFEEFLIKVYKVLAGAMKENSSFYVFYKELGEGVFITSLAAAGLTFKQELIWVKNQLVLGGSKYQSMYEPCLFGCKGQRVGNWNAGRKETSVIESIDLMNEEELRAAIRELTEAEPTDIIRERKPIKNDLHPTMKPIKLLAKFIRNSSKPGEVVLDVFGGSGSTLLACEQLNRKCCTMELDEKFVDVIIERWENFTGEMAEKIN